MGIFYFKNGLNRHLGGIELKKVTCLNCGSDNLVEFKEKLITEYRKINKDGTISKRKEVENSDGYAWGIQCRNCNSLFDYETDSNGKVISLDEKCIKGF
jgi:hypothetical protein